MTLLNKYFRQWVKKEISLYVRSHKSIAQCYLRHSAAFGPHDPLLSDFDLTFFVNARDLAQLKELRAKIKLELNHHPVLRYTAGDAMFLPATRNSYQLCEECYPFRLKYPISSWLSVDAKGMGTEAPIEIKLPLDHCPEFFLNHYLIPVARGLRKRHFFERGLIQRKLMMESSWAGIDLQPGKNTSFDEALLMQTGIWDIFYKKVNIENKTTKDRVYRHASLSLTDFLLSWKKMGEDILHTHAVNSLWVHPSYHDDAMYNVTLNLKQAITPQMCRQVMEKTLNAFSGLKYNLFLGTEDAMIGRINGLTGPFLLDPWRFKVEGVCLFGDPTVKERIVGPSQEILRKKYHETLLSLMCSSRFITQEASLSYAMYRLCFTMEHFFKNNEMILDEEGLRTIYGQAIVPKKSFSAKEHLPEFLLLLKEKHNFDLFGR